MVRVRIILGNRSGKTRTSAGTSLEHNSTFVNSSHRGVGERAVSAVSSTIDRQSPTQYPSTTYSTRFPIPPGNPRQLYIYIYIYLYVYTTVSLSLEALITLNTLLHTVVTGKGLLRGPGMRLIIGVTTIVLCGQARAAACYVLCHVMH